MRLKFTNVKTFMNFFDISDRFMLKSYVISGLLALNICGRHCSVLLPVLTASIEKCYFYNLMEYLKI